MRRDLILLISAALILVIAGPQKTAKAQSQVGDWTSFVNLSNSPVASTYPSITADSSGNVHVLWSEDVGGKTSNPAYNPDGSPKLDLNGNPMNILQDLGNTLYYTRWDGEQWLTAVDVQANPNGYLEYPRAAVDSKGVLHVVWIETQAENVNIYYSHVPADKADSISEWAAPVVLVEHSASLYYPVDIAVDSKNGIHVVYAQLGENPGAYVINSTDGGNNWSDAIQLYATSDPNGSDDGVSTFRLIADSKDRLHASWTHYDRTGNGKGIYYSQSDDFGNTWSRAFEVARWQPGWYETDWLSIGVLGDEIHLTWEGGKQSYLNERISEDGGQTWGDSHRILTNLVGENGFADMVVDSANQLRLVVVKRGEKADNASGIWLVTWDKDHWADPILAGTNDFIFYWKMNHLTTAEIDSVLRGTFAGVGPNYPVASILNGNELFVAVVNEVGGDIWSSHTTLDAPFIPPHPYPKSTPLPTLTPTPDLGGLVFTPTPLPKSMTEGTSTGDQITPTNILLFGITPAALLIIGFIIFLRFIKRT